MKINNKLLKILIPVAAVSTIAPTILTSCSMTGDVVVPNNQSKTFELKRIYNGEYAAESGDDVIFIIADKYAFDYSEAESHCFKFEYKNLKPNDKVQQSPNFAIGITDKGWAYDSQNKCTSWTGHFLVQNCILDVGAEITFDLIVTFGTRNGDVFTPVSKPSEINGWKFTYNGK